MAGHKLLQANRHTPPVPRRSPSTRVVLCPQQFDLHTRTHSCRRYTGLHAAKDPDKDPRDWDQAWTKFTQGRTQRESPRLLQPESCRAGGSAGGREVQSRLTGCRAEMSAPQQAET